mmetsp:Transcript_29190/g.46935  ORF Transcript_29190/g.46935 Transcript_29190/m.46935 type:complete len:633 (+) Transcript_29190:151-2049(+)
MNPKASKILATAGVGLAGYKLLDAKYNLGQDLKLISRLVSCALPLEIATNSFTVCDKWEQTAAKFQNKACVVFTRDERVLTFAEVDRLANKVATYFRETLNYEPGDVVALFMENRPEYLWILLGLSKAGLVAALINSNNKAQPFLHSLDVAKCRAIIYGTELVQSIEGVFEDLKRKNIELISCEDGTKSHAVLEQATKLENVLPQGDIESVPLTWRQSRGKASTFAYIYTSGTTGLPKASIVSNYKFLIIALGAKMFLTTPEDRVYTCLPLYHSAGLGIGAGSAISDGCTLILSNKFSARRFMHEATIHRATVVQYIGELCRYLVNSPETEWDTKHSIRIAIGNGLRKEVWVPFQQRFNIPEIGEFYGATEGNISFGNHSLGVLDGDFSTVGSVGQYGLLVRKVLGYKIVKHDVETESIIRDSNTGFCIECEPGEPGELLGKIDAKRMSSDFVGYTDRKASAKKIVRDVFVRGDAYFRAGDLMRQTKDGHIYFVDRIGDTFRWKGENVSTGEVSQVINVFPGILEANVYGVTVPGNEDGRACMAAIVSETEPDGFPFEEFSNHVHKNLGTYAVPLFLRFLPEMDVTGTFKHRKVDFVKQGIDLNTIRDPVYALDPSTRKYTRLSDGHVYSKL